MTRSEIISKEVQRRELVQRLLQRRLTSEELKGLHQLDNDMLGIDIVGVLLDELQALTKPITVPSRSEI